MKKSLLFIPLMLLSLNFISAYGQGISDLLEQIDPSTLILGIIFIICFALLNFVLGKYFKDNKATAGIVSFSISLLIIYGINRSNFDYENLFYDFGGTIGLSEGFLELAIPIILIAGIIYVISRFKKDSLFIIGGFFILLSFFIHAKELFLALGIILVIIGFFVRKGKNKEDRERLDYELRRRRR